MSAKFDKVLFLSLLSSVSLLLSVKQQAAAASALPESEAAPSSRLQVPPANADPILSFAEPLSLDTGQSSNLAAPPPTVPVPVVVEQPVALSQTGSPGLNPSDLPVVVVPRVPPGSQLGSSAETMPLPVLPVPSLPLPPVSDQAVLPPPPDVPAEPSLPPVPPVTEAGTDTSAPSAAASNASDLPAELSGMVALAPLPQSSLPAALVEPPPLTVRPSPFVATDPTANALSQPPLSSLAPLPLPTLVPDKQLPTSTVVDDSIVLLAPPPTSLQANPLASARNNYVPGDEPSALLAPDANSSSPVGSMQNAENLPATAAVNQPAEPIQAPSVPRDGKILTGVDVSGWQDEVDWQRLKENGVEYAYLKSTEGRTFVDPTYEVNRRNARKAGVITGAYHFFRPATPVLDQVDNFMKVVGTVESDDLPPALDLEDPSLWRGYSHAEKLEMVLKWLQEVEKRTGVRPIIYASPSFVESVLGSAPELASYKLWLAHYTSAEAPSLPKPFSDWLMWQYSEKGRLPGVVGNVDLNRFRGHPQELLAQARGDTPSDPNRQAPPVIDVASVPQAPPVTQPLSPPVDGVDRVADVIINFDLGAS